MILSILVVSSSISTMPKWIGYGSAQRHENHMYQHFYLLLFEGFIILTYWHPLLLLEKLLDDPNHLQKIIYFHVTAICKTLDVFFFFMCAPLFTINNPFWVNMTNCGASVGICLCYPYDECSCNYLWPIYIFQRRRRSSSLPCLFVVWRWRILNSQKEFIAAPFNGS